MCVCVCVCLAMNCFEFDDCVCVCLNYFDCVLHVQLRITLMTDIPVQVDGEPWVQPAGQVVVLRSALKVRHTVGQSLSHHDTWVSHFHTMTLWVSHFHTMTLWISHFLTTTLGSVTFTPQHCGPVTFTP